ncbi:MAG: Adaptive-response sensory-kinase SasA [Hyphomicrobiaceae bacterium hypho_1]
MLSRYISSSLLRRIVVSNLLGLVVLFFGFLYISQFNIWLIDTKRDSLQLQSRLIASAIASSLYNHDTKDLSRFGGALYGVDPFADLMFTLRPERVSPVLRRLLRKSNNQAKVYDIKGNLIADSQRMLPLRGPLDADKDGKIIDRPPTKNFWTRLKQWFLADSELKVYRELGDANGHLYPEVRIALKGKTEALLFLTRSGKQIVSVATPIQLANEIRGVLLLSTPPGEVDKALAEERLGIFALALVALCAAIFASYLLKHTVAGPMRQLSTAAENVTRDIHSAENLPKFVDREDEVGQLARSFTTMTRALLKRIDASEKFAADIAHELKNPLTAARSTAESLTYAKTETQRSELVEQIQLELQRLNKLITDVSNASRLDAELARHTPEPVDLGFLTKNVCNILRENARDQRLHIELNYHLESLSEPHSYIVSGHEGRLGQVLMNVIDNALSFSPKNGIVDVCIRSSLDQVIITVTDEGPGIEQDKLKTIFTRFYTYRPSKHGSRGSNSGLGLSISNEIIQAHGGTIWAENLGKPHIIDTNGKGAGARFTISLPAARKIY